MSGDETSVAAQRMRLWARIRGRVQGVGFRYATQVEARRLGLSGWVRNCPGGDVELVAEGSRATLDVFLAFLRVGPRMARVQAVDARFEPSAGEDGDFIIRT